MESQRSPGVALAAQEIIPMKPTSTHRTRFGILAALLAAFAVLALPAIAPAQDPAGDQYLPSTPNGGGDYDFGDSGQGTPVPQSGSGSAGSGGASSDTTGTGTVPATPADPAGEGPARSNGNRDQRTVSQIGAEGEQARDAATLTSGSDVHLAGGGATTSTGLGAGLWILAAAALAWAIGMGVVNFRRREQGHQPA